MATPETSTLRFITCGSVDDGKSTLIGRLLHDSRQVFDDQWASLASDSRTYGTQGERVDLALLVDGLQAEREAGITIDVAYRFFQTPRRHFIVADCPGHEEYTRNMATGASTAHLAVLLVDARKGLLTQTARHSRIVALLGVKHVLLAINKMDLVGYDQTVFQAIETAYRDFAAGLGFSEITAIPVSALEGDNVVGPSPRMPWYAGPTLLGRLESVELAESSAHAPFRMPVQWVNRPEPAFRGYAGRIASGTLRPGDAVTILPSGATSRIARIVTMDGDLELAAAGRAVTVTLEDERDVSRGDVLVQADAPASVADQFEAKLVWLSPAALVPGRSYHLRLHTQATTATVTRLKWRLDVNTGAHLAATALQMNEIACATLAFDRPVAFAPYAETPGLGAFLLIDRQSNETVGAGMIDFALRRSANVAWQAMRVDGTARALIKQQAPRCVWLTGLSGSGKSTIASALEQRLFGLGRHTYVLDGDNVRHGLNRDLGFTEADRVENIRRIAEVARLMADAGLIVIVSAISPYRADRDAARALFGAGEFVEVFVNTPLEVCAERDPKGLYAKALRGELTGFTGVSAPYEAPESPEIELSGDSMTVEACVERLVQAIEPGN